MNIFPYEAKSTVHVHYKLKTTHLSRIVAFDWKKVAVPFFFSGHTVQQSFQNCATYYFLKFSKAMSGRNIDSLSGWCYC